MRKMKYQFPYFSPVHFFWHTPFIKENTILPETFEAH